MKRWRLSHFDAVPRHRTGECITKFRPVQRAIKDDGWRQTRGYFSEVLMEVNNLQ
jgi:hypothetical protein